MTIAAGADVSACPPFPLPPSPPHESRSEEIYTPSFALSPPVAEEASHPIRRRFRRRRSRMMMGGGGGLIFWKARESDICTNGGKKVE